MRTSATSESAEGGNRGAGSDVEQDSARGGGTCRRWFTRALGIAGLVAGAALGLGGCPGGTGMSGAGGAASNRAAASRSIPADTDRFPHGLHTGNDPRIRGYKGRGLVCTDCHPAAEVAAGRTSRPGTNQHAPCDDCHKAEFYKPPGAFCRVCHVKINPRVQGATTMQPYPVRGHRQALASRFSHALHLDSAKMDAEAGFHLGCSDCHQRDATSRDPMLPGHKQCARCHGAGRTGAAHKALALENCAGCHPQRDIELARGRLLITGDLTFAHKDHEHDMGGKLIPCQTCHEDIRRSQRPDDVSVPRMQRCAICHEDSQRTPEKFRIARCETCHSSIMSGRAPANHMVGTRELPEDHTIEFRHDHAEQAAAKNANCRFCHEGLSGSPKDSCFQCHEQMKPRDHGLSWREDEHGHEAEIDRERCATCHRADYCTACHSIPPRSHQPYEEFRLGGHADAARFELSSCMACHTYQATCSDCHRGQR